MLAINRGEREGVLKGERGDGARGGPDPRPPGGAEPRRPAMAFVRAAAEDAYDRLIFPSVEREMRGLLTEQADEGPSKCSASTSSPC